MKRHTTRITILCGLVAAVMAIGLSAAQSDDPAACDCTPQLARMARHLDLTTEQQARLGDTLGERGEQRAEHARAMREARQGLREQIHAGADEGQIRQAAESVALLEAERAVAAAARMAELRAVLTDEQLARLDNMKQRRRARMERGPHGDCRCDGRRPGHRSSAGADEGY